MFVKIDNCKNVYEIDALIKKTRDDKAISPEFALDVLRMGNYYGNIKKLLRCIEDLDESEWGKYKGFALSCVYKREVSVECFDILCKLAKAGDYEDLLKKINAGEKIYGVKCCKVCYRKGKYIQEDLSNYDVLHHQCDGDVVVWEAKLPKVVDFSECKKCIDFKMTDCADVEKFLFDENVERVRFIQIKNEALGKKGSFPRVLDLRAAKQVAFDQCSFEDVDEIKFKEGSYVCFIFTENHPKKIDFSKCEDLAGDFYAQDVEELVFDNLVQAEEFMGHIHQFKGKTTVLSQIREQQPKEEIKEEKVESAQQQEEVKERKGKSFPSILMRIFSGKLDF